MVLVLCWLACLLVRQGFVDYLAGVVEPLVELPLPELLPPELPLPD